VISPVPAARAPPTVAGTMPISFRQAALLDAAHDAYADWRDESFAVERLYTRWRTATSGERALAFAGYAAALEREERAAQVYADMVRLAATHLRAA
jgi:hypothetical protein